MSRRAHLDALAVDGDDDRLVGLDNAAARVAALQQKSRGWGMRGEFWKEKNIQVFERACWRVKGSAHVDSAS